MANSELKKYVDDHSDQWVAWRRHLHAHPELSFEEEQTAAFIVNELKKCGVEKIQTDIAGHGIAVDINSQSEDADWILLRADMDALPIHEKNDVPYKSKNEGVMHACGHDVHSTVMMGVVKTLVEHQSQLEYNVRVIFQPGEELLPGGASLMIKEGVLEDHNFVRAIALHVYPELNAGSLGFKSGLYMASCDEIYIDIKGKGGHGALPERLVDPLLLGAQMVTSLQQVVSRKCPPAVPCVLSIGKFIAEGATNVIPSEVHLEGTFRTYNEAWRAQAHDFIKSHLEGMAHSVGAEVNVEIRKGYPFLQNDEQVTQELEKHAQLVLDKDKVKELSLRPTGEDFAFFSHELPVCFFRLGTGEIKKNVNHGVHHPEFDIDEKALKTGIYFLTSYLLK